MKTFFKTAVLLFLTSTFLGAKSHATLYESDFESLGRNYVSLLNGIGTDSVSSLAADDKAKCEQRYNEILNDGVIDIRIAIGYFDWTIGKSVVVNGTDYGLSPSIDIGAYQALEEILTSRCYGRSEFCGFSEESSGHFAKNVQIEGKSYRAQIRMEFSSVSEYFDNNTGRYKSSQDSRSQSTRGFFVNALGSADAVFYLGHSRNGGGPDFNPPIFIPGMNKVNYNGYYRVYHPGLKTMLSGLSSSHQPSILGLMSCDSRDHFLGSLHSKASRMGVISSTAVLTVNEVFTGLIGGVDAVLRGQCQRGFYKSLRLTPRNQTYITSDYLF